METNHNNRQRYIATTGKTGKVFFRLLAPAHLLPLEAAPCMAIAIWSTTYLMSDQSTQHSLFQNHTIFERNNLFKTKRASCTVQQTQRQGPTEIANYFYTGTINFQLAFEANQLEVEKIFVSLSAAGASSWSWWQTTVYCVINNCVCDNISGFGIYLQSYK